MAWTGHGLVQEEIIMTTNNVRSDARLLMSARPGMKYTEALRKTKDGLVSQAREVLASIGAEPSDEALRKLLGSFTTYVGAGYPEVPGDGPHHGTLGFALPLGMRAGRTIQFSPTRNILVTGAAGMGASVALMTLSLAALRNGWRVKNINAKCAEYQRLSHFTGFEPEQLEVAHVTDGDSYVRELLATEPGSVDDPLLLVLDGGLMNMLVPYGDGEPVPLAPALDRLQMLMADPNTAVALRMQLVRGDLPRQLADGCAVRAVMGRVSSKALVTGLRGISPDEALYIQEMIAAEGDDFHFGCGLLQTDPGETADLMVQVPATIFRQPV